VAAHRKFPPNGAANDIHRLAAEGYSQLSIAAHFNVSRECFKRWLDEDEALSEAFDLGRETERQALHAMVVASARANKPANVNAFFLLKARHGYVETDNKTKVNLDVAVNSVMVMRDHGDDATWAAKCAAQQRALTADCINPPQIEASFAPMVGAMAASEPQTAPVSSAPYYGPPVFEWQSQLAPVPCDMPELPPSPLARYPSAPVSAPVWRGRA